MDTLQQIRKPIGDDMDKYKQVFDSYLVHSNPILKRVLENIARRKGKMMRPMLTLLAAQLVGGETHENTIYTAATFEFFHTASLVHDDVVDESGMLDFVFHIILILSELKDCFLAGADIIRPRDR